MSLERMRVRPAVVDGVVFNERGRVLLVLRANEPEKGKWAIPGGFVDFGETAEQAIVREVGEETGLKVEVVELLGVYSDPKRDVRQTIASVFICRVSGGTLKGGDDAVEAKWFPLSQLPLLGFDHSTIIRDARKKLGK